jgi:pimeloyl-ACP methyl ester carboxylesterase
MRRVAVEFDTRDGTVLRGCVQGSGPRWAILVHDAGRDLDAFGPLTAHLAQSFTVLAIDLRGHGLSDGVWDAAAAHLDLDGAVAFARGRGALECHAVGVGTGAAAIVHAGTELGLAAHVLVCCPSVIPGAEDEGREAIRRLRAAKLMLVGWLDGDRLEDTRRLVERAIGPTLLVGFPTEQRGHELLNGEYLSQAVSHTRGFLAQHRSMLAGSIAT